MKRHKRLTGRQLINGLRSASPDYADIDRELALRSGVRHKTSYRTSNMRVSNRTVKGEVGDVMPADLEHERKVGQVKLSGYEQRKLRKQGRLGWRHPKSNINPPPPSAIAKARELLSPIQQARHQKHKATLHDALGLASYLCSGRPAFQTVGDDDADVSARKPVCVREPKRKPRRELACRVRV